MNSINSRRCIVLLAALVALASGQVALADTASDILAATGVKGGLVVHIGSDDGTLTAALGKDVRFLVQGLDADPAKVAAAQKHIQSQGVYGRVSADRFDGKNLPFVSNLVNLIIASDLGDVTPAEIRRVLAPDGVAYVKKGGKWTKTVKPRPAAIDEWSHFLHDSSGNAVANDRTIGPPKRLQWVAGPKWCRSHETPSSVNAVVTAGGRLFTIFDEGPTGVIRKMPQRCKLIARDTASGVLLWKVPMQDWQPEFGTGVGNRWNIHHTIPRRIVASGDRVYVTLRFSDSPVSVLDATTGKTLSVLEGSKGADEMLLSDGVLVVKMTDKRSVGATQRFGKEALDDTLAGFDVKTGKQLWRIDKTRVVPYALSALSGRLVYHTMEDLVCVDIRSGKVAWRTPNVISSTVGGGSTLVLNDGVVLFHGHGKAPTPASAKPAKAPKPAAGKKPKPKRKPVSRTALTALALADGKPLWTRPGSRSLAGGCTQPTDLFVANGLAWCGTSLAGVDIRTGEVKKKVTVGKLISPGHHYRCFRGKATERFLIYPKRGAEFVDLEGDGHMRNDWLRSPCFTGATPANGLFYTPTSQCFCYPGVLVTGFLAMSAEPMNNLKPATAAAVEKGPAFGKPTPTPAYGLRNPQLSDWPMYRRNVQRTGSTTAAVLPNVTKAWETKLACNASPPVYAHGKLYVAEKDAHRIRCLLALNGESLWTFTAGGRIDSAPTISKGLLLFGSRDGSVYCLRADDGKLVWRFRAAPTDQRIVSFDQVESLWPVNGSVLVLNDVVYFAAGRSSYLDGGIIVYGLDVRTGKPKYSHHLEGPWPDVKTDTGTPFAMEGATPDLLVSDGTNLFMKRIKFDAKLNRLPVKQESSLGELDMGANHLVATGGFLDDSGYDRIFWMHSKHWPGFYLSQHSPKAGQLIVFDDTTTYAIKYFYRRHEWSPVFIPGDKGYLLYADDINNQPVLPDRTNKAKAIDWLPEEAKKDSHRRGGRGVEKGTGWVRTAPAKWQKMIPLRVQAMVLAGDRLFTAGTPDIHDPKDPLAALEGRKGTQLQVFSTKDGSLLNSRPLPAEVAFDGMIAANGKLFITTKDAKVICMEGKK